MNLEKLLHWGQCLALLLVIPLVVGHGGGVPVVSDVLGAVDEGVDAIIDTTNGEDRAYVFTVMPTVNPTLELGDLGVTIIHKGYRDTGFGIPVGVNGGVSGEVYIRRHERVGIRIAGKQEFEVGEVWMTQVETQKRVKLMAQNTVSNTRGTVLLGSYFLHEGDFDREQEGMGAATSSYSLSGDILGSDAILSDSGIEITLNGEIILTMDQEEVNTPFSFQAEVGDILQIKAISYIGGLISEIWLHHPSGKAEKLTAKIETNVIEDESLIDYGYERSFPPAFGFVIFDSTNLRYEVSPHILLTYKIE